MIHASPEFKDLIEPNSESMDNYSVLSSHVMYITSPKTLKTLKEEPQGPMHHAHGKGGKHLKYTVKRIQYRRQVRVEKYCGNLRTANLT